ncbi:MAG: hypothetical protein ABIG63_21710 [Chloroflexota bacterium]
MKTNMSYMMGTLRAITSILWVGLCVLGLVHGLRGIEWAGERLDENLTLVVDNLDIANDLLQEIMDIMSSIEQTLTTVKRSTVDTTITLTDSRILLDEVSQVITQDVPEALDGVQESMPGVIEAAALVDDTLIMLSAFQFKIPIPFGQDLVIGLGVDYNPEIPLDQALENLSSNLEDVPEDLRNMEDDLTTASVNLLVMRDDLSDLADDLFLMRAQVEDINPQIEAIATNVETTRDATRETQGRIPGLLRTVRNVFIGVMILLIISQIPSGYMGWLLTRDGFPGEDRAE